MNKLLLLLLLLNVQFDRTSQKLNESREKSLKQFWEVNESLSMANWFQQSHLVIGCSKEFRSDSKKVPSEE